MQFVKEVTNDVIARGISSNRVINNCFDYHINKNKHTLDENKMKDLLNTLKKDIGIVDDENSRQPRSRSGSRRNSLETSGDKKYLTLQRLGTSTLETSASRRGSKTSLNNSRLGESKGIINDYENQITENIHSIRRNSKESLEGEKTNNANNSFKKSSVSSSESPVNNQLNVSRNSLKENQSRKNSTDSESTASASKKTGSILKKTNYSPEPTGANKENLNPDSDSDDDIYMGKFAT